MLTTGGVVLEWGRLSQNRYCVQQAWTAQIKEEKNRVEKRGENADGYYFSFCIHLIAIIGRCLKGDGISRIAAESTESLSKNNQTFCVLLFVIMVIDAGGFEFHQFIDPLCSAWWLYCLTTPHPHTEHTHTHTKISTQGLTQEHAHVYENVCLRPRTGLQQDGEGACTWLR